MLDILERMRENNKQEFPLSISSTSGTAKEAIEPASSNEIPLDASIISKDGNQYFCNATLMDGKFISIDYLAHKAKGNDYMYLRIK